MDCYNAIWYQRKTMWCIHSVLMSTFWRCFVWYNRTCWFTKWCTFIYLLKTIPEIVIKIQQFLQQSWYYGLSVIFRITLTTIRFLKVLIFTIAVINIYRLIIQEILVGAILLSKLNFTSSGSFNTLFLMKIIDRNPIEKVPIQWAYSKNAL